MVDGARRIFEAVRTAGTGRILMRYLWDRPPFHLEPLCGPCTCPAWTAPVTVTGRRTDTHDMLDIVLVAAGLGFFALAIGYVSLCERL